MDTQTVDVPDTVINDIIFDENHKERASWRFYNSTTLPRSEVLFFVQTAIIFLLIVISCVKLMFFEIPCEDRTYWCTLLSGSVGFLLPSPRI